jgi:hypothetical protein
MTKEEFYNANDFGVSVNENFEQYIIRVGNYIQEYKRQFGEPSEYLKDKIIEIFESTLHPMSSKYIQVYNLLQLNLKRKPTEDDFDSLVKLVRGELDKPLQKQLYNVGIDPYPTEGGNAIIIKKHEQEENK